MANPMGDSPTYEVQVDGPLSDQLIAALGVSAVEEPAQTLLLTPPIDQGCLLGLIDRVSAFGLELVEVRRSRSAAGAMAGQQCYQVAVRGLLGPALLTAVGGSSSAYARRSNSWTFRCSAPDGLAVLMQLLAAHRTGVVSLDRVECTPDRRSR
jgi:hypothetical protein